MKDVAVSMVSGALTGAITGGLVAKLTSAFPKAAEAVGKIPLADWAKVGLFNTGDGILGRMVYAVADGNMSVEEKFAYAFSPEHMAMDFLGGAAMYGMSKVLPKVREKLPWNKVLNEGGLDTIIKNGKVSIDDIKTNPSAFSGKSAEEIADVLRNSGYDVTIKNSTRSRSGAQIIQINNSGGGKNISQVQVSPGGGRHGSNPYVKISTTDQGIIKIVDGIEGTYKTDGKETATIIFSGGN